MVVERGEIWWADLGEPTGSEPGFRRPVLVVQSDADQLFPLSMAKAVFDAATVPKRMVVLHGYRHEDGHLRPTEEYWLPVIRFLASGGRSVE